VATPRFKVVELKLEGAYYLPLPKLNPAQMAVLGERLRSVGLAVHTSPELRASGSGRVVHYSVRGVAWSIRSPMDLIAPVVPKLLKMKKRKIRAEDFLSHYFVLKSRGHGAVARMFPRMETSRLWRGLRAQGVSALTPDEAEVVSLLLSKANGKVAGVSTRPVAGSRIRQLGKKVYHFATLDPSEFASELATLGDAAGTFLPPDGILRFQSFEPLDPFEVGGLASRMGQWCYFLPETAT
jgi:hypothetical protein